MKRYTLEQLGKLLGYPSISCFLNAVHHGKHNFLVTFATIDNKKYVYHIFQDSCQMVFE